MTTQDHAALAIIGKHMAATNGYKAEQASDLYVSSGTSRDYQYGVYRIFAYTFEMSVDGLPRRLAHRLRDRPEQGGRPVPDGAGVVPAVRARAPPCRKARCGAFDDDLEVSRGWAVNPDGTDTAPASGRFVRANPAATDEPRPQAARDHARRARRRS